MGSVKLKLKTSQMLKDGTHPIIIQVLKDTKKAITTLGMSCSLEEWNVKTNLPKNRRASIICQKKLLEMEGLLFDGIDNGWTAKKIVSVFSGKDSAVLMFFEFLDEFLTNKTAGSSTKRGNETKRNKFYGFLGNKDIRFKDIDYDLLKRYRRHLDDEGIKTANRYLKFIKRVYDVAVESDKFVPKSNPFKSFLFDKSMKEDTLNRNLSNEQVAKVLRMDSSNLSVRSLKNTAIDFWKFCFYMRGINLIDIAVLSPKDVEGDYLVFTREKLKTRTKRKQKIRIFPEARGIIEKYLNPKNDFVFPILENGGNKDVNMKVYDSYRAKLNTVNRNLKLVGEEIELDFVMTTMSARYSFINVAKQLEIPFLYLQEFVGHSTRSTTDIYMDVFPQEKIDEYHRKVIDSVLLLEEREEGKNTV